MEDCIDFMIVNNHLFLCSFFFYFLFFIFLRFLNELNENYDFFVIQIKYSKEKKRNLNIQRVFLYYNCPTSTMQEVQYRHSVIEVTDVNRRWQ